MKLRGSHRNLLKAILTGIYTPFDLREFVKLSHHLALPFLRKKIFLGKLKLPILGMPEADVMFDCLADVFQRDERGRFQSLSRFFEQQSVNLDSASDALLTDTLRRFVFSTVNLNLIRLYSDADPVLGRILHNLHVAVERTKLFRKIERFGESYLTPIDAEPLLQLPPMPLEYLQAEFSRVILLHDSVPEVLKKLHNMIIDQNDFQRALSFLGIATLLKQLYLLASEAERTTESTAESVLERNDMQQTVDRVCDKLKTEMWERYVLRGKKSPEVFEKYIRAVHRILNDGIISRRGGGSSFFDLLRTDWPELTKKKYIDEHKTTVEYFVRLAKRKLRRELAK